LFDKLSISRKDASRADLIRMNKLAAAIYMTAQGIPFIHAGEEFLREKLNQNHVRVENSYNAPDFVNKIRWDVLDDIEHSDVVDYYRGLVAFRKAHPALRLASADEVTDLVTYKWITNEVVLFEINGKPVIDGETAACIYVIFNATQKTQTIDLSRAEINFDALNVYIDDVSAGTKPLRTITQPKLEIAPISALVMTKE
jgi:pullulanase